MEKDKTQPLDQFSEPIPSVVPTPSPLPAPSESRYPKSVIDDVISWVFQYRQRLVRNPTMTTFTVHMVLYDTLPQTANNFYTTQWIAPFACRVVSIRETHKDAATSTQSIRVYKSGTDLLSSYFDVNGIGGDVISVGSLSTVAGVLNFSVGDRLHWGVSNGSVAGLRGLCVTVEFQPI